MIKCKKCGATKSSNEFHKHSAYANGRSTWCRECHRQANRKWYIENKEKQNAKSREWQRRNPEITAQANLKFKRGNKERLARQHAEWAKRNKDKRSASAAARKAAKLKATPSWADMDAIANVYRLAKELQELTGVPMHVDHIVPLKHPKVCGLHCEDNLQILPARFNETKKNKWPYEALI